MSSETGVLGIGVWVVVILVVAWIVIPIVLLNINAYMRRLWKEQQKTNALLESLRRPTTPRH